MSRLTPAQLVDQLKSIKESIKTLNKKKFRYFIHGKYIANFGALHLMEDLETVKKAFSFVKSQFTTTSDLSEIEIELGISKNLRDEDDSEEQTYLGYTLEEWKDEFSEKVKEIQNQLNIEKLEEAYDKLEKYRSESDRFTEDADEFADLFTELGINEALKTPNMTNDGPAIDPEKLKEI